MPTGRAKLERHCSPKRQSGATRTLTFALFGRPFDFANLESAVVKLKCLERHQVGAIEGSIRVSPRVNSRAGVTLVRRGEAANETAGDKHRQRE